MFPILFMKYIRRSIINDIAGSPLKQKAVALAILLKEKTNDSSVIHNFTIYKVHSLTGMAYKTIRLYLGVLKNMGLAEFSENDLTIKKMSSSSRHRNIDISAFEVDRTRNIYNQIRELLFLIIQANKDYIRRLLRLRHNPTYGVDFKAVRRFSKKCCDNPNAEYKEWGLSYNRIAKKVGCCGRTAFNIVKDAIKRNWCRKVNRCEVHLLAGVNYQFVDGYSFTTANHGFILRPNTYILSKTWKNSLNSVPKFGVGAE